MTDEITATGVVISTMPIGEFDKRVVMLTGEYGKIHAFARGARRPTSPMLAGTEPLTFAKFKLRSGKNAYSLLGVEIADYFEDVREDFDKLMYGLYFLELASFFGRENLGAPGEVKLVYAALKKLAKADNEDFTPDFIRLVYELKLFNIEGFLPQGKDAGLSVPAAVYAVDYVERTDPLAVFSFTLADDAVRELRGLCYSYLKKYTDNNFKSLEMLNAKV